MHLKASRLAGSARGNLNYRSWLRSRRGLEMVESLERRVFLDANSPAVINIGSTIAAANTSAFGTNIQQAQLNNLTKDPGFEPIITRLSGKATGGGANFITNDQNATTTDYGALKDGFFNGATVRVYRIIGGVVTLIRTDTVTTYLASSGSGYRINLASSGTSIQSGDIYYLDQVRDNALTSSVPSDHQQAINNDTWYWLGVGNPAGPITSKTSRDSSTEAPDNGGQSSMRMDNFDYSAFSIQQFDYGSIASGYQQLVPGKTYRVSMWLKQQNLASGQVTFKMDGEYSAVNHTFSGVNGNWQQFTYDFVAPAYPVTNAIIQNVLSFQGTGSVWVDNLLVYDPTYDPFAMQPQALQALQNFNPGTLRIWSGQTNTSFGTTLENWTNPDSINQLSWDPNYGRSPAPNLHLPSALALAKSVDAQPWLIVGSYMSEDEWKGLFEYLAGPAGTPYGDKRIAQGHAAKWTDDFSKIYLELGNETWNSLFRPWTYDNGTQYGQFAEHFYQAAKSSPYFAAVASKIQFTLGGWNIQPGTNGYGATAAVASPSSNVVTMSGYIGNISGAASVTDSGYQSLLVAQPDYMYSFTDATVATQQTLAAQGHPYQLAVYEGGPSYNLPNPNQPFDVVEDAYGHSLAAGVGVLDSALYRAYKGFVADNFFLYQPGHNWASTSTLANGYQPYSSWLALQMRNQYASGDMLTTSSSQMPTIAWNSSQLPAIGTYAFKNGNDYSVIVLSRDLNDETPVTLNLPFTTAAGGVTLHALSGDPRSTTATIQDSTINTFSPNFTFTMPAGSIYVFNFSTTATTPPAAPAVTLTPGNGQVTLNWGTVPSATSYTVKYGTSTGNYTTTVGGIGTTSKTVTGLTNGTPYYFIVTASNAGGEGANSPEVSGTPAVPLPAIPTGVAAAPGNSSAIISWNAVAGATSYTIKYGTASGNYTTTLTGFTGTSGQVPALTNGTPYYFVVSAVNGGGEGQISTQVSATPTAAAPTVTIDYSGGFASAGSGMTLNGTAKIVGSTLSLADNRTSEAASAYANTKQNVASFTTQFDFLITGTWPLGDGFTFVIQNAGLNALGQSGGGLGYGAQSTAAPTGGIGSSLAIKFDVYGNQGEGANSTGLYLNGAAPTILNSIDLSSTGFNMRSYDLSRATITYDGTTLTVQLKDLVTNKTATQQYAVNIPAIVGGPLAWVGFTAGTGALISNDEIKNWTYTSVPSAPTAPPAPTGLAANPGNGQIGLSWNAVAGATSYNLKYGTVNGNYTTTVPVNGTSTNVPGLTNGTTYYFVVSAINGVGEGNNSTQISSAPVAPQPPVAPTGLAATPGNGQIGLTWNSVAGATSYNVKYGTSSGNYTVTVPSLAGTSTTLNGLTNGTTYFIVVSANNAVGEGNNSAQISSAPVAPQPPTAPTGLAATPGNGQIGLTWNSVAGATSYNVKYGTSSGTYTVTVPSLAGTSTTLNGLTNGTTYFIVVSANNAVGEGSNSAQISSSPVAPQPPVAPTGLFAAPGNGQITLTWNASAGATSYNVKYGTSTGDYTITVNNVSGTTRTITGLTNGTPYYFVVSAVNAVGEGNNSAQASATPAVPSVPVNTIDFSGGFAGAASQLKINGSGKIQGTELLLTSGGTSQVASAYALTQQNVAVFSTTFDFQINGTWPLGDGFTFVIQRSGLSAIGQSGGGLGYGAASTAFTGGIQNSVAIKFDVYGNQGEGANSTGLYLNGAAPTFANSIDLTGSPFNMRSYNASRATIDYDGTTLTVVLKDLVTGGSVTQHYTVDIPGVIGDSMAWVGFTAANGSLTSNEHILSWTYATINGTPVPPAGPSSLTATPDDAQVALSWATVPSASSYTIKYGTTPGNYTTTVPNVTGGSRTITGLTNGTTYYFVVASVNSAGEGGTSPEASAKPLAPVPQPPVAPTGLVAAPSDGQVVLNWAGVAGATSYNVKVATTSGGPYTTVASGLAGTTKTVAGLTNGTPYYFVVSAVNGVGESGDSAQVAATPSAAPIVNVNYGSGFAGAGSGLNLSGTAAISGSALQLLSGSTSQAASAYAATKQNVTSFSTQFDFQVTGNWPLGDGFTFVIQNAGANAIGQSGGGLGYQGIGSSVAIKFDYFSNAGEGTNSTGLYTNGQAPTGANSIDLTPTGFNMRSYNATRATITYNGSTLTVGLKDLISNATATQTYTVNIPAIVGGNTAWVGFTGGDGALTSVAKILNWTY